MGISLQRLQEVVKKSEQQYPRREWHRDPYRADAAENLWPRLTGDFNQTLKECESLLISHDHLRNGRTSAYSNLRWWLSAEDAVDNLMAKLRFHITKVDFYSRPAEIEGVIRNGTQLQQLRRQVANLERMMINGPGPSPSLWANIVPEDLKAKFAAEFHANRPVWFVEGSGWPLKEGFEALAFHFARGTIKFNPTPETGETPELLQYLNLAKAAWILDEIKQSQHFKAASTESVWADHMRELEDDLRGQVHRFDNGELRKPTTSSLLELPSSAYAIGRGEESNQDPLDAGKAGDFEEKILQMDFPPDTGNREFALLVFRETLNETDFRLVTSMRQADTLVTQYDKEVELNMERNRLIPVYGNPAQGLSPRYNLLLLNEKGRKPKEFNFEDLEDVKKLQRALTGYRVHHDMPVARWCINGSDQPGNSGKGRLQLWQFKPLPPIRGSNLSDSSDSNSIVPSSTSKRQNGSPVDFLNWQAVPITPFGEVFVDYPSSRALSLAEVNNVEAQDPNRRLTVASGTTMTSDYEKLKTGRSLSKTSSFATQSKDGSHEKQRQSSIASGKSLMSRGSVMTPVQGPRGRGTQFVRPELPVLIIFTLCNGRYTFLHLTCELLFSLILTFYFLRPLISKSVDASIHVNPKACKCRNPKLRCKRVILESKNPSFTTRVLSADQEGDGGLESWDLSVFRYPRSEKWKQAIVNESVKTLELEFADVEGKRVPKQNQHQLTSARFRKDRVRRRIDFA